MSATFNESIIEEATLSWLESLGYSIKNGLDIAPGEPAAEAALRRTADEGC